MSDSTTPILGLVKPLVGGSADSWGGKQNTNEDTIDSFAGNINSEISQLWDAIVALQNAHAPSVQFEAIGTVKFWPGNYSWPPGYVVCDGGWYLISSYPQAFNVVGFLWGGDGANYFAVPDLRGRAAIGCDEGTGRLGGQMGPDQPGGSGGTALVGLSVPQMPPHAHGGNTDWSADHQHYIPTQVYAGAQAGPYSVPAGGYAWQGDLTTANGAHYHNIATDTQGSGAVHTNVQPGALGYWMFKIAPT